MIYVIEDPSGVLEMRGTGKRVSVSTKPVPAGRGTTQGRLTDGRPAVLVWSKAAQTAQNAIWKAKLDKAEADKAARKYTISKITITRRIIGLGLEDSYMAALQAQPKFHGLWLAAGVIKASDPDVNAFLTAIGADLDVILAPES